MTSNIQKPKISSKFTIEDIHSIRVWNYERQKDMTDEEKIADTRERAKRILKNIKERSLPFEPAIPSLDEQLLEAFQKLDVPVIEFEADENGNVIIDERIKKEHPELYDWVVNG